MKRISFLFLFLFPALSMYAQEELSLHFMRNIWQTASTNPATMPENKLLSIGLPSLYYNLNTSGIILNDFIGTDDAGNRIIDIDQAISRMDPQNQVDLNLELESLNAAYRYKNWCFSIGHAFRGNLTGNYPKDLIALAWKGNGQFIGDTISIGPDIEAYAYNEFRLGAAYQWGKLTVGARLKYLVGGFSVSSDRNDASLFTSDDIYQLTFTTDYRVRTASLFTYEGFTDSLSFTPTVKNNINGIFSSNHGFAFDLGIRYQITDKLEVAASILDIGAINWTHASSFYSHGTYQYNGLQIEDITQTDSLTFQAKLDTLKEILDFKETPTSFKTTLPLRSYISGAFRLNDKWRFGGLLYFESANSKTKTSVALNAQWQATSFLNIGAVYAIRNKKFDNIGLNFTLKLGPVQIYALTDSILTALTPKEKTSFNSRFGLNLVF